MIHDNLRDDPENLRGSSPCLPNAGNEALHQDLCLRGRSLGQPYALALLSILRHCSAQAGGYGLVLWINQVRERDFATPCLLTGEKGTG